MHSSSGHLKNCTGGGGGEGEEGLSLFSPNYLGEGAVVSIGGSIRQWYRTVLVLYRHP